jgi:hypothetical protein
MKKVSGSQKIKNNFGKQYSSVSMLRVLQIKPISFCPCALNEHHAVKAYWGSGVIAPRIIDLGTGWRFVVNFTPRLLYPQGKSPWYALDRRLSGTQRRSGGGGVEKNSQPLLGLETPIVQPWLCAIPMR